MTPIIIHCPFQFIIYHQLLIMQDCLTLKMQKSTAVELIWRKRLANCQTDSIFLLYI